ncbi:hypothetical protein BZA77DRAFT_299070 [Pyronema omphalodes]|nr:hypothetical protein BZA77DRAFT_299070 [Pyronema omphalodes]
MSRPAKLTLLGTTIFSGLVIAGVHYLQQEERASMHAGVIRDEERTRVKRERQADFDLQAALQKEYMKDQHVKATHHEGDHRASLEGEK